tara:strand:+ start:537 stop:767 length:231 start_codon:yes stop_codon:yes gene_type:complete
MDSAQIETGSLEDKYFDWILNMILDEAMHAEIDLQSKESVIPIVNALRTVSNTLEEPFIEPRPPAKDYNPNDPANW